MTRPPQATHIRRAASALAIAAAMLATGQPVAKAAANANVAEAVVEQPRPFGYVLGDKLTQRVRLPPNFEPEALPPLERAGLWFARHVSKVQTADDNTRWLVMEYQVVNAPQALMTVNMPQVALESKAGDALAVAPWTVSVSPLTPHTVFAKDGLQELRPDHPAPNVPTSELQRQLETWLTVFATTVAAWLGWWVIRSIRAAANQPFAKALREIRQAGDDNADAWLSLHRAFDRTAGRALQASTLTVLFKHAPHFESQRPAIERFYEQSNLRFFGRGANGASSGSTGNISTSSSGTGSKSAGSGSTTGLRALATTLRRIEKQHER